MTLQKMWDEARELIQPNVPFSLRTHTVAVFRVGSHSHGTHVPPEDPQGIDDIDLMVIVIPPPDYKLGIHSFQHLAIKEGQYDVVVYEWGKWLNLLLKQNPNVVGTLWLQPEDNLLGFGMQPLDTLFKYRKSLLSKAIYPAFIGYAHAQLYKMTHCAHQGYMGEKRKALVEQFGYDVKNAAHLIRLMRMAIECLDTRTLTIRRPDAAELITIKRGGWTKEQVFEEAGRLFAQAECSLAGSSLPEKPDFDLLNKIMVSGYRFWWRWTFHRIGE